VPIPIGEVCTSAARGSPIFAQVEGGQKKIKALRHCQDDRFSFVYDAEGGEAKPLAEAGETVHLMTWGKALLEIDMRDLWREITRVQLSVFLPWFLFAVFIKLAGIFANIWRWHILLVGQGIHIDFKYLTSTYFVGRYFGIVTPSTMGLDGWRLYDTIRITRKPVECTTALGVERLIGLVGLLATILLFMPFADMEGQDLGELVSAVKVPLACAVIFAFFMLVQPAWFTWMPRLIPVPKVRTFAENAIRSATAYSSRRLHLLGALAAAVFGQVTTMFMYFGNAMALGVHDVPMADVLYASAVMTLGTFVAPSASGEGVRELVFVNMLQGKTTETLAFLIGHLGFWIEKLPLSIPGGLLLFLQPDNYKAITAEDLERIKKETAAPQT
jgi:uncharacterized membrane protein YbhN (UPF0104 family)